MEKGQCQSSLHSDESTMKHAAEKAETSDSRRGGRSAAAACAQTPKLILGSPAARCTCSSRGGSHAPDSDAEHAGCCSRFQLASSLEHEPHAAFVPTRLWEHSTHQMQSDMQSTDQQLREGLPCLAGCANLCACGIYPHCLLPLW